MIFGEYVKNNNMIQEIYKKHNLSSELIEYIEGEFYDFEIQKDFERKFNLALIKGMVKYNEQKQKEREINNLPVSDLDTCKNKTNVIKNIKTPEEVLIEELQYCFILVF